MNIINGFISNFFAHFVASSRGSWAIIICTLLNSFVLLRNLFATLKELTTSNDAVYLERDTFLSSEVVNPIKANFTLFFSIILYGGKTFYKS